MSRALFALGLVGALVCATDCGKTRACKPGTLFVDVSLDAAAAAADTLLVSVDVNGATQTASGPHAVGATHGAIEVDFAGGYPKGSMITLTVTALAAQQPLAMATAAPTLLSASCASLSVQLQGGPAGASDDMADIDGGTSLDLTIPPAVFSLVASPLETKFIENIRSA